MKVFITNKKDFEFALDNNSKQAHIQLYNEVFENFNNNNKIDVIHYITFENKNLGVLFEFKGKNNDIFFYEYLNTTD